MKIFKVIVAFFFFVEFGLLAQATMRLPLTQERELPIAQQETRPGSGVTIFGAEQASPSETVTGAPYTATAVIESTQTLADGNHFVNHSTVQLARDSKGRERREETISKVGELQVTGTAVVFIHDPVAQLDYVLDPTHHTFKTAKASQTASPPGSLHLPDSNGTAVRPERPPSQRRQVIRESLGTQVMEGLNVEGTRVTSTIPAGLFGNERAFSVSVETWYCPDLHIVVLRKRSDPRNGDTVYRLTDIRRVQPDAALFQVPSDYKSISETPSDHSKGIAIRDIAVTH